MLGEAGRNKVDKKHSIYFVIALVFFVASFILPGFNEGEPGWRLFLYALISFWFATGKPYWFLDHFSWILLYLFFTAFGNIFMLLAVATLFIKKIRFITVIRRGLAVQALLIIILPIVTKMDIWKVRPWDGFCLWLVSFVLMYAALKEKSD